MVKAPASKNVTGNGKSAAANAKDPSRPKRRKAKRACYACQRAHLTCGDERPCQRCITRGLADVCQDGICRKARHLRSTPNEARSSGAANHYNHGKLKLQNAVTSANVPGPFYAPSQSYFFTDASFQTPPPQIHGAGSMFFGQQCTNSAFSVPQPLPILVATRHNAGALPASSWENTLFGTVSPAPYNFDLASMNFGDHSGAMHVLYQVPPNDQDSSYARKEIGETKNSQYSGECDDSESAETASEYLGIALKRLPTPGHCKILKTRESATGKETKLGKYLQAAF